MREPIDVEADVGNASKSAKRTVKAFPFDDSTDGRVAILGAEVEIENLFPHGDEKDEMALLAGVLLRDLEFDGFVGEGESGEKRRDRFPPLEMDGAVLDLDNDVVIEFAVKGMKDIEGGAGAIGLEVMPIEMMIVDK